MYSQKIELIDFIIFFSYFFGFMILIGLLGGILCLVFEIAINVFKKYSPILNERVLKFIEKKLTNKK